MGSNAIYSAISGLQADSTWLDVIGNNIANVNTIGYKSSSASFANQFSQALSSGSGDDSAVELGGVDSEQVGGGTRIQSIQTNFTEGSIQQTGVSTDIAIQGDGFIMSKSGSSTYLTRAGNLNFDSQGYLVDSTGAFVQGYTATLQYSKEVIDSGLNGTVAGTPLSITSASLQLNDSDPAAIGNIQINPNMTMPPAATTQINFTGNLDAAQQANSSGGILNMAPGGQPVLPVAVSIIRGGTTDSIDTTRLTTVPPLAAGQDVNFTFQQVSDLSDQNVPLVNNNINLATAKASAGNYAWEQQPPLPPATQISETVYDSNGNPRQITIQFYQINSLTASGPSQACYAWYAFDTTDGQSVSTNNLLGGTGIGEGDLGPPVGPSPFPFITYDRDETTNPADPVAFGGDFIFFNTDGSLGSSGGTAGIPSPPGAPNFMSVPRIYLPNDNYNQVSPFPTQGAEISAINLDFGTFGPLGTGERDGLTGDAEGSYQTVNGLNTYVPDSHITATQNGYADGTLQSMSFDSAGTIVGSFSNGQTADLAQLALANVNNEEGLINVGDNHYQTSTNSGAETIGQAGQNGLGTIEGDSLEGSNVDLTTELTNMIIAQKGFDTNARMISTMNDVLQIVSQLGQ